VLTFLSFTASCAFLFTSISFGLLRGLSCLQARLPF
jgi:hypothetical protein